MAKKQQNTQAKIKRQRPQKWTQPQVRPVLCTMEAYIVPKRVMLDGKLVWAWVVTEFLGDTFLNGDVFNPPETAPSLSLLLQEAGEC